MREEGFEVVSDFGRESGDTDQDNERDYLRVWLDHADVPDYPIETNFVPSVDGPPIEAFKKHLEAGGSTIDQFVELDEMNWMIRTHVQSTALSWTWARLVERW